MTVCGEGVSEKDINHSACNIKAKIAEKIQLLEDLSRDNVRNAYMKFQSQHEAGRKLRAVNLNKLLSLRLLGIVCFSETLCFGNGRNIILFL